MFTYYIAQPHSSEIPTSEQGTYYSINRIKEPNFEALCLNECGTFYENDWESHPERLKGLISSISKTPLKTSLKVFDLNY